MALLSLTKRALRAINATVDGVFKRIKWRVLGPNYSAPIEDGKIKHIKRWSLPGLYHSAAAEEAMEPNEKMLHNLMTIAEGYLDAEAERTKAKVAHAVHVALNTDPEKPLEEVLMGELEPVWESTTHAVVSIVDTEGTTARNMATLEGVARAGDIIGNEDPYVFFIPVRDNDLCAECKRVHLLPDGKTPRVFKMSEVSAGYHDRGSDRPSVSGLHPHCRCSLTGMARGYGFDGAGMITFVSLDHDEFARQRSG
jgi:hypothetical protein